MYVGEISVQILEGYTRFESLLIEQIHNVLKESGLSLSNKNVLIDYIHNKR